ncbi:hypothetical protein A4X06_0g7419 [Tilletia controversa]|uniref:Uncharacterized protein n=1 Tax=Tilletia controversa TaxID=13291 RepID=A0A8X7SU58_9BASI|nr:hypothetical protein A4X06_0g7419 [Tilletia controversa]
MPGNNDGNFNGEDEGLIQVFGDLTWTPLGWSLSPTRMLEAAELSIQLYNEGQPDVAARIRAIYQTHKNEEENPQAAHFRALEVSTDRLAEDIRDELVLVHNLLTTWTDTHERLGRTPWSSSEEDDARSPAPPAPAATGPASSTSRHAEKRRVEASPPRQGQPAEKRSRVVEEPSASEPEAAVPRPDGKRKAVTIHRGVSSSEGAGSLRPPKKTVKKVADLEFVPLWLLSKDACRRAAEKETVFKKPMIQNSDGTFVEADEACPDGYVQEGDLDWILWNECTKMRE